MDLNDIHTMPPVTKALLVTYLSVFALVHCQFISGPQLVFIPANIKNGEIWRLISGFFYFGPSDATSIIKILFFYFNSRSLESRYYNDSLKYAKRLLLLAAMALAACFATGLKNPSVPFLAALEYIVQARDQLEVHVRIFIGIEVLQPFHRTLTAAIIGENSLAIASVIGVLLGHIIYFSEDVMSVWY